MGFVHGSRAENSLRRNPFYLLGATTKDNQGRIIELAEQRTLTLDPNLCRAARSDLANPRLRLSAEVSWLPGVAPDRANEAAENWDRDSSKKGFELPPLARGNALAACIEDGSIEESEIVCTLLELSSSFDEIDPEVLMREVNEDRSIANFPLVEDIHLIHAELAARRRYYRDVALQLLDSLPTKALVRLVTELTGRSTERGRRRASRLVEDIVENYEDAAQGFMQGERYNIRKLLASVSLRAARGEVEISDLVESLRKILGNWNYVAKPIQVVNQARGLDHPASHRLALQLKSLSAELRNRQGFARAADELIECLRTEFAFLSEFSDRGSHGFRMIELRAGKSAGAPLSRCGRGIGGQGSAP